MTLAALLDGHGIPGAVFTTKAAGLLVMSEVAQPPDPQRTWNAIIGLQQAGLMTVDPPGRACGADKPGDPGGDPCGRTQGPL